MTETPETSYYGASGRPSNLPPLRHDPYGPGEDFSPEPVRPRVSEPGLPGWAAIVVLIAISAVGGLIDQVNGASVRGAFNYGLIVASLIAILLVKRSQMFGVVISPPLVYLAASAGLLYVRTGGLHDRGKLLDAATNWVVYGFPAIAGATAAVLVVAGLRLILKR